MLSIDELNDYTVWLKHTPAQILFAATSHGGWANVFRDEMPIWASRVRNYFNVLPSSLTRMARTPAEAMMASKHGPRLTFLANCHQDRTFNLHHRGKPTPLGPAPDAIRVNPACPLKASKETMHMDNFVPTRDALSGDVYLDDHGWTWFQMSPGATIYHWGSEVKGPAREAIFTQMSGQENVPVFKLVSMDGSGGSREVIISNPGALGPDGGQTTIGKINVAEDIYKRIIRDNIKQGSYNYSESTQVGMAAHELRDVQTHYATSDFYVNPINMHASLDLRKFPVTDKAGDKLEFQWHW